MFGTDVDALDISYPAKNGARLAGFSNLVTKVTDNVAWCAMSFPERPCFSLGMLGDILDFQNGLYFENERRQNAGEERLKFGVLSSTHSGVFSLGGDLRLFVNAVRSGNAFLLRSYAHLCVDTIYKNWCGLGANIVVIALVQGAAMGGGMEAALSGGLLVAERDARLGLPEIGIGLFPGMGAYPLLAARIGMSRAERLILGGEIYSAQEMYEMGVVDILAESGRGADAVVEFISKNTNKHNALASVLQQRRAYFPLTLAALRRDAELWVEAALGLTEKDLEKMERLASVQLRIE